MAYHPLTSYPLRAERVPEIPQFFEMPVSVAYGLHPQPPPGISPSGSPPLPPAGLNLSSAPYTAAPLFTRPTKCSILLCIFSQQDHSSKQHRVEVELPPSPTGCPSNDKELFYAFRKTYNHDLRTFWQRYFSLRGLKYITILEYTVASRPVRIDIDVFARNDIMYAFQNPDKITSDTKWIDWVFELKSNGKKKYALEFVEGWKGEKILLLGAVPWVGSCLTAIIWSACGGDVQVALAVASFILTASGSILALLAILSTLGG